MATTDTVITATFTAIHMGRIWTAGMAAMSTAKFIALVIITTTIDTKVMCTAIRHPTVITITTENRLRYREPTIHSCGRRGLLPGRRADPGPIGRSERWSAGWHRFASTELVVSPTELTVYLVEGGKVIESKGATNFRAVVQQGGKTETVSLEDQRGKRLSGKLDAPLKNGSIVVITGKDSHLDQFNARYTIK